MMQPVETSAPVVGQFVNTSYVSGIRLSRVLDAAEYAAARVVRPNVRAKRATTAGRQGPVGENVPRTADRALVACRWRSA